MQALIKPLLVYLVYPLAENFAKWIYSKYIIGRSKSKHADVKAQRKALTKALKEAKDDEQIKQLSIILHSIDKLN